MVHQLLLETEKKTYNHLFFYAEVLHIYSLEELRQAEWLRVRRATYEAVLKKFAEKSKNIQK